MQFVSKENACFLHFLPGLTAETDLSTANSSSSMYSTLRILMAGSKLLIQGQIFQEKDPGAESEFGPQVWMVLNLPRGESLFLGRPIRLPGLFSFFLSLCASFFEFRGTIKQDSVFLFSSVDNQSVPNGMCVSSDCLGD